MSLRFGRESALFLGLCSRRDSTAAFALSFISGVSSASGFSANPLNAPSIAGSRFAMAATDSKMNDRSLHSVSPPEKVFTIVHHAEIHLSSGVPSKGLQLSWASDASILSFSELLEHFCQCLGQLLHRHHVRSARQFNTLDERNGFLSRPSECALHHGFQIRHGCHRLRDEQTIHSSPCRDPRKLDTLFRGLPCYQGSCSLGFCCQSLSFSELLAHFRQFLGQLLHRRHVRSPRQVHSRTDRRHSALNAAPLPCCNVWMTNAFLAHHEKAVRTRCHDHYTRRDCPGDETQTGCQQESGSSLQMAYKGLSMYNVNRVRAHVGFGCW